MNPSRKSPAATGLIQNNHATYSGGPPLQVLLPRLERVHKAGDGYRAECPIGHRSHGTLSIVQGPDGRLLLHCFAGCEAADVLGMVGLKVADLFERRDIRSMTPGERAAMRQGARIAQWRAALGVLSHEALVTHIAAEDLAKGEALAETDRGRLAVAARRILEAREVLS